MMRTGPLVLCIAVGAALAVPVFAEGQAPLWQVSIGGGPSFPMANLADEVGTGYHMQTSLGYRAPMLPVGLRLDAFYQDFDAVEREPSIHVARGKEWYRQLSAVLNATIEVPVAFGGVRPYGLLGAGWLRAWHDDITYSGERNATVSFNAGAGLDLPIFGMNGFVETRYMGLIGGEPLRTGPPAIHPEVNFTSIPVTIGIRF